MKISKKIFVVVGLIAIVLVLVLLRASTNTKNETDLITPTGIVQENIDPIYEESQTGAIMISPTEEERIVNDSVRILRDKCPIETDDFVLDFDYKRYTFIVKTDKEDSFWTWLDENGYIIPVEDFVIEQ